MRLPPAWPVQPAAEERAADDAAFRALEARIVQLSASGDEGAAEESRAELWSLQKAMDARGAELAKLEREKKFNADDMCHVTSEKSLVGRCSCHADPSRAPLPHASAAPPASRSR